jgi:hypothetical protein
MDKEKKIHVHHGILFSHKDWISSNLDERGECYIKWNKADTERPGSYNHIHL